MNYNYHLIHAEYYIYIHMFRVSKMFFSLNTKETVKQKMFQKTASNKCCSFVLCLSQNREKKKGVTVSTKILGKY